jgi:small conductance mechanosensitive channel
MIDFITPEFWTSILSTVATWAVATVPSLLLTLIVGLIGLRIVRVVLRRTKRTILHRLEVKEEDTTEQEKRVETIMNLISSFLRIVVWVLILMLLLRNIGIDIGPLLAGAGIAGLAVGFGAQELVRDFISGIFILLENRIREGDVAIINGVGGLVEEVGLRTVVLRDLSGVVHVYQNGKIDTLSNMTKEWSAMVFDIGVAYKEDTDEVSRVMARVAEDLRSDPKFSDQILEPLEMMGVDNFADSAVVVRARFKTKPLQQWAVGREYRRRLKKAFDEQGIEIPFPHQTLYWGAETDPLRIVTVDEMEEAKRVAAQESAKDQ